MASGGDPSAGYGKILLGDPESPTHGDPRRAWLGSLQEGAREGVIPMEENPVESGEAPGGICWAPYMGGPR